MEHLLEEAWGVREFGPERAAALLERLAGAELSGEAQAAFRVVSGYQHFRDAREAEALQCAEAALAALPPTSPWVSRALNVRSAALLELGEIGHATVSLREQLRVSRALGDAETEGAALHDLGAAFSTRSPGHADEHLEEARRCFQRLSGPARQVGLAFVAGTQAELRASQGRPFAEVEALCGEALTHSRACGHRLIELHVLTVLGGAQLREGLSREGERTLRAALVLQSLPVDRPLWVTVPPLARLLLHGGRHGEARALLEAQLRRAREAAIPKAQAELHGVLSEVLEAQGDAPGALAHAREHLRLYQSQHAAEQARKIRGMEVLHRTELAQQQAQSAQQQAQSAQQQAQAQRRQNDELRRAISELEALHRQVEENSFTDELTGVRNRHFLMTRGANLLHAAPDSAVAILDIDHFKRINDTLGHDGGDRVLRAVAQHLREHLFERDVLARFGGEEFVVLFLRSPLEQARLKLDALRAGLRALNMGGPLEPLSVSFTAGVVGCPSGDLLDALRRADQLLYRGKRAGRDRVTREALPGEITPV